MNTSSSAAASASQLEVLWNRYDGGSGFPAAMLRIAPAMKIAAGKPLPQWIKIVLPSTHSATG
jgi:hypothetical protein